MTGDAGPEGQERVLAAGVLPLSQPAPAPWSGYRIPPRCACQRSIHEHLRVHRESSILLLSVGHSTGGGVRTVFWVVPAFSVSASER